MTLTPNDSLKREPASEPPTELAPENPEARYCALCDHRDPRDPWPPFTHPNWNWACQECTQKLLTALDGSIYVADPERPYWYNRLHKLFPHLTKTLYLGLTAEEVMNTTSSRYEGPRAQPRAASGEAHAPHPPAPHGHTDEDAG